MRLKLIGCQVLTREIEHVLSRSPHSIELEMLPMGLHDMGAADASSACRSVSMRRTGRVMTPSFWDMRSAAGGTEGLRAGKTQLVLPRAHDCIGLLMGSRHRYQAYFDAHPGIYFALPAGSSFRCRAKPSNRPTQPRITRSASGAAAKISSPNMERTTETISSSNSSAFRRHYSGLTYISTGVESEDRLPRPGSRRSGEGGVDL